MPNPSQLPDAVQRIIESPSYRIAFKDADFLSAYESRGHRLELEFEKPERKFNQLQIESTIPCFGATRVVEPAEAKRKLSIVKQRLKDNPKSKRIQYQLLQAENVCNLSKYYDMAREFARIVSEENKDTMPRKYMICTGGGPGIMEAANRGAADAGAMSIGLNISLPMEQRPNAYITPELCFQFHYFAVRKQHFLMRARALVVFPGGYGTLDELFDAVTPRQTGKMQKIPILLFGWNEYWKNVLNLQYVVDTGLAAVEDLDLIQTAETPEEAWHKIKVFHGEA